MAQISDDDVRHIAKLARLHVGDDEVSTFATELGAILSYVDVLQRVNTDDVEPTAQVTGLTNRFRTDEIEPGSATTEELLDCSPLPIVDHQIETPSTHGSTKPVSNSSKDSPQAT